MREALFPGGRSFTVGVIPQRWHGFLTHGVGDLRSGILVQVGELVRRLPSLLFFVIEQRVEEPAGAGRFF